MSDVTLYTIPNCVPCSAVKMWLNKNKIEYEEKPAIESLDYLSELGYRQAPVIVYQKGSFSGFDVSKLSCLLST